MGDGGGGGGSGPGEGIGSGVDSPIGGGAGSFGGMGTSGGSPGSTSATAINAILAATVPGLGAVLAASDFGANAQGDSNPAFGTGVSGPDSGVGVGGGPEQRVAPPVSRNVVGGAAAALPDTKPVGGLPNILADIARRRFGRQETILTRRGALSDTPTLKPTLLGQ